MKNCMLKIGAKTVTAPPSTMNKLGQVNGDTMNYKVLGRVLAASWCIFILLQDGFGGRMMQKDNNHLFGLIAATVCGMICGVAVKVVDLTQEHGLRISPTKEFVCYLVVLLNIFALCTVVPGGQSFIAYFIVYHGLIKAKADTCKHLFLAAGVYSLWIYLTVKEFLSVDWLFVAVTVAIATLWNFWSILNNKLFCMGDTFANRFSVHIIILMANLVAFSYDRFVAPALIMVAQICVYATTKMIAEMQTWYTTSKREDLVAKNYLTIELFTILGAVQWLLTYILMLWEGVRLGTGPWPVNLGSYYLVWEFLDSYLDYFNKGAYTSKEFQLPKRILYALYFVMDAGLHVLFVVYGLGMPTDEFDLGNSHTVQSRFLYLAAMIAMWMMVFTLCSKLGLGRQIKYCGYAVQCINHTCMVRLPAYASSPLLMTAAWISALGNSCYLPKMWSTTFPKPKMLFSIFAIGLVVVSVLSNIFHHELRAMPASQHSFIAGMWLVFVVIAMTFAHHWWKDKICY